MPVGRAHPLGAQAQGCRQRVQRLALPPDELHPAGHRRPGSSCRSWATRVGRSTLFGIPLQQQWSYANSGDFAPTYYLQTRRAALLLLVHRRLHRQRLPLAHASGAGALRSDDHRASTRPTCTASITSAACCTTFPGVFTGIGEFSIHKEFVSSKVAGETASLTNPALDRILDFAAEAGLVVILHNDIDMPFAKHGHRAGLSDADEGAAQAPSEGHDHLGPRRPRPHRPSGPGLGGSRRAQSDAARRSSKRCWPIRRSATCSFDISWDEVAKYAVATPESIAARRRDAQQVSGSVPVRHRHGRAGRPGAVLRGLRHVGAGLARCSRPRRASRFARATTSGSSTRDGGRVRAWEQANVK